MILAAVMGVCGGVVGGMLGVGGGIVFVPALSLLVSLSQVKAEATSLLAIIPVAVVGAVRQHRYGNVRVREAAVVGALSAVGVLGGVALANVLPERALKLSFALLMLVVAGQLLRRFVAARRGAPQPHGPGREDPNTGPTPRAHSNTSPTPRAHPNTIAGDE